MAGETGGPEDRYLMFKAVERELKEMKNSIKVQRAMHDMTQQELADRVGVSRQTINAVELGKYVPSAVLAMKVAAAFGRRVEEVFTLEEEDWGAPYRLPDGHRENLRSALGRSGTGHAASESAACPVVC